MAKTKEEAAAHLKQSRKDFALRLRCSLSGAKPKLEKILEDESLCEEVRQECMYGLKRLEYFNGGGRTRGWPSVKVSEFLNKKSPLYEEQVAVIEALRVGAMGRFFNLEFFLIRDRFMQCGVRLPAVIALIHSEFREEKVQLSELQT